MGGGTLTGSRTVVYNGSSKSVVNVYGGTITGGYTAYYAINNVGTITIGGSAKVTDSSNCAVFNNSANAVIIVQDNVSISSSSGAGINSGSGTVIIKGGTVAGNTYGINMNHEKGRLTLEETPVISGTTADLYLRTAIGATLDNVKVDATGYNGSTLSVMEYDTASREGAYAIKVSNGKKDKFTLINDGDVVYQYKDGGLMLHTHTHSYTYTADGAVITESCSCGHKETATLSLQQDDLTYTGSEIKPVTVSYSSGWVGNKPNDSAITYSNNTNAGSNATASLEISDATASLKFTIAQKPLTESMIALASNSYSYTGSTITPTVTVTDGGKTLASSNYDVSYLNNTNVGTATVTVTGKNNYSGSASKTFQITAADISSATVTLSSATLTYNGSAQTKGISSVKVGSTTLTEGTDYTISGNIETNAGTHTITITGIGGYAGSTKTVTFRIEPKPLTADMITLASDSYSYTGSAITPAITVKDGNKALEIGTDYTVSYADNVSVGTGAKVTVTGTGNYSGSIDKTFTIAYSPLPSGKSLTDYVTISPSPTNGWYGSDITLTPINGCGVGETPTGIGNNPVTISQETGTDGSTKTIYIKDGGGNIYQTEFPYKLDKTAPAVNLKDMTVENGKKTLWDWIIGKTGMIIKIPDSCIEETLSGIAEVSYTATPESGGAEKSGTIDAKDGIYEIALDEEFTGTIQLTVKDKAGHATQVTLPADGGKVIAEDYAPVVKITPPDTPKPNENDWYNEKITITVTVTDDKNSSNADIISGGIAEIKWKDGENGAEQIVADLPGNDARVYTKEFTISVNTEGAHTYYVNAVDNAGNESGWQTYTVKVDIGKPVFNGNLTVKNRTKGGADITFIPSEGGKAYWIVSDEGTVPTAQQVKEQSGQKGGVQGIVGGTESSFNITGLTPGEKHTVYVVLEDAAGNLSDVKTESFLTLQKAPDITPEQLTVDYIDETVKLPDGVGDVEVYTNSSNPSGSKITPNADGSLPVTPGTAVYIRYPEKTEGGMTVPASDKVTIQIPGRPDRPAAKEVTVTDTTADVTNPVPGEEYVLVEKGQTPDWSSANTTGQFTGLDPNKEYDLYVRKKATGNSFASEPEKTEIRTSVTIREPVITGDGAGKSGNTAPKPDALDAGGTDTPGTVTFTGTYSEEYTPVIKAGGQEILPGEGTAGSKMTWNENSQKGSWEYTYPIPDGAKEVGITVEFRKRTITEITAEPDSLTIYADDAANVSMDTLHDYVKANSSARAVYDNKTSGTVQAAYSTTGSFIQKGKAYTYTTSAEGKTDHITLTVSLVSVLVTTPDKYMQTKKAGGYTVAEVNAWLPSQVSVTYTGDGYTTRTENRTVTWNTNSIGSDFGAATGKKTITGTVNLPAWATGRNSVSMEIEFVDKIVLKDDQIQLSMPGFSYGAQVLPNPQGSITVADTNPAYTYLYSMDGGATWVTADRLPKSGGGYVIPGGYRVKMAYTGDSYTGEKTAFFTVAEKELTILPGTLEVESRNDDGTKDASLKEGGQPVLSGVTAGDDVTPGGSLSAVFAEAGPKKNIPVTVTGFALEGRDAGCYKLKNTTLTLYATINNADGTPPSDGSGNGGGNNSSENGGNNGGSGGGNNEEISGGDGSNNGNGGGDGNGSTDENSGGTSEDDNGSGTPAAARKPVATQPPVASSAAAKQPAPGTGTSSGKNGGTQSDGTNNPDNGAAGNTDTSKPGAEPGNTDQTGQDNADPAQTEGEASQTLQASIDGGKLTMVEDLVTTGNITEASETTTILEAGDGAVIVTVVCEDKEYTAGVRDTVAVANAVLTPEQIQLVGDGETIEIRVDVKDISETVPGQDKEIIEGGLAECRKEMPGLTLGMYVDISMFIKVGEGGWDAVTHTEESIDVVIGIPEELKADGRKFTIIRSHDGAYALLPDMDDNPDTITVSTDLFSAYAIAYEQAGKAEVSEPGEGSVKCGLCHICPTFLGICYFIWLAVIVAIFLIIGVAIWRKRKEENEEQ